jgi:hypothetical protein
VIRSAGGRTEQTPRATSPIRKVGKLLIGGTPTATTEDCAGTCCMRFSLAQEVLAF